MSQLSSSCCANTAPSSSSCCMLGADNANHHRPGFHTSGLVDASEFQGLSPDEQASAYNELHCIPRQPKEDPGEINRGLYELNLHLEKSASKWNGYRIAQEQNQQYVEDRKLRLAFLRVEEYDPKKAARRMLRFLDEKLRLFGREKLTQDILYQDLSDDTRESLACGAMQYAPLRDQGGRLIWISFASKKRYKTVDDYVRAQFFFIMSVVEDESVQLLGIVGILYNIDSSRQDKHILRSTGLLRSVVPMRLVAGHVCLRDSALVAVVRMGVKFSHRKGLVGYRLHVGTHIECMYSLMSYGIPVNALPFRQEDGRPAMDSHMSWLQKRQEDDRVRFEARLRTLQSSILGSDLLDDGWCGNLETLSDDELLFDDLLDDSLPLSAEEAGELTRDVLAMWKQGIPDLDGATSKSPPKAATFLIPTRADVLLGRGRGALQHPGNVMFRNLVASTSEDYEKADKTTKVQLGGKLLNTVKRASGRFLKSIEKDLWVEIDDHAARDKIAMAFRSFRKSRRDRPSSEAIVAVDKVATEGNNCLLAEDTCIIQKTTDADVLFGRGRAMNCHPGNIFFRNLVASRRDAYEKARKRAKVELAEEIIGRVKEVSGRFLRPLDNDEGWEQVDDHTAHLKVASAFRSARKAGK